MSKPRVAVGISGGVDSSVAALLLLQQGYDVHGVFMKNWEDSFEPGYCAVEEDLADAEDVCATLGIALHKVNFSAEYRERVFSYFLDEYAGGRTPNPDVLCNTEIKFKAFLEHASSLGAEFIATGHYARRQRRQGRQCLLKGLDRNKDQSYFLHGLDQSQLASALFPVGELMKSDVRGLAAANDLVTQDKKDSTGICFIGERDFRAFLSHYLPAQPGPMQSVDGESLGQHQGLMYHTLGQRKGLHIGGRSDGSGQPWFVVDKDIANNVLVVAQGGDHPRLYRNRLRATKLNWIAGATPHLPPRLKAKTRYRQADQDCEIRWHSAGACEVVFDRPQRAVTPGQSVVFYRDDECLGGGTIDSADCVENTQENLERPIRTHAANG